MEGTTESTRWDGRMQMEGGERKKWENSKQIFLYCCGQEGCSKIPDHVAKGTDLQVARVATGVCVASRATHAMPLCAKAQLSFFL